MPSARIYVKSNDGNIQYADMYWDAFYGESVKVTNKGLYYDNPPVPTVSTDNGATYSSTNGNLILPLTIKGFATEANAIEPTYSVDTLISLVIGTTTIYAVPESAPQPTLTFKHFYDAGTIGSGTYKFRHYSQQEPSSGQVIKAGTYKWVDTPDIQGIADIIGEDGSIDGQFKSSDITFDYFEFSVHMNRIAYGPSENFTSLIGDEEVDECGYLDGQWGVRQLTFEITDVPALQTLTILEDIDLTSVWNNTEIEQAILTWFTANTTKLS